MSDRASGEELTLAYEILRAHAMGEATTMPGGVPTGLAVFLRGGVSEWMATWRRLLSAPAAATARSGTEAPAPAGMGRQMVMILAEMALRTAGAGA